MAQTFTSAAANKMLRALRDERAFILTRESETCTYVLSQGEIEEPPAYDYDLTREQVDAIDAKSLAIRHALHVFNAQAKLPDSAMTIDEALVRIAQLSERKERLAYLRALLPKERVVERFGNTPQVPQYRYANFDVAKAADDYARVTEEIAELQLKIDLANQTLTFEVDI